jgi:hypothetical protein
MRLLLGGERFHGRLDRLPALPNVPTIASCVDRAGADHKIIRRRSLIGHTHDMAWTSQHFHRTGQAVHATITWTTFSCWLAGRGPGRIDFGRPLARSGGRPATATPLDIAQRDDDVVSANERRHPRRSWPRSWFSSFARTPTPGPGLVLSGGAAGRKPAFLAPERAGRSLDGRA